LSSYASADNILSYPTQPFVDFGGMSFTTNGGGDFNIGFGPPYAIVSSILNPGGYFPSGPYTSINLQISQTPLPPTWTMMLIGIAGFGFVAYRRRSKPTALMAA
jgi:PEP-CTERM motif-containing protein